MFLTLTTIDGGHPVRINFNLVMTYLPFSTEGQDIHTRMVFVEKTALHVRETVEVIDARLKAKERG